MKILLFGATGMVGQGVLRECLLDPDVQSVVSMGRSKTGQTHPKLREIVQPDMFDYSNIESQLTGFDACFFTLGITSIGMNEPEYKRITYDLTLAAATTLARLNPKMTFVYVSGAGTDSSEKGKVMWARIKGKTENALLALPFKASYMFRPGFIEPMHGIKSRTALYNFLLVVAKPLFPLLRALFPSQILTTESIGRAMLVVEERGAPKRILESRDIAVLAKSGA